MSPGSEKPRRRTGRRPGASTAREDIVKAARDLFARQGYDVTSLRAVSRAAGVDPALVHHYFGDKNGLLEAVLVDLVRPASVFQDVIENPTGEDVGERLVRAFLGLWDADETREPLLALVRASFSNENAAERLGGFMTGNLLARIIGDVNEATMRAALIGSQLVGLAFARYVLALEPLASADSDTLVKMVGPTVQRYLTAPSDELVGVAGD